MDIEFIVGSREQEIDNPRGINCSEDIAYVIYTSGTTGKPKGHWCHIEVLKYTIQIMSN